MNNLESLNEYLVNQQCAFQKVPHDRMVHPDKTTKPPDVFDVQAAVLDGVEYVDGLEDLHEGEVHLLDPQVRVAFEQILRALWEARLRTEDLEDWVVSGPLLAPAFPVVDLSLRKADGEKELTIPASSFPSLPLHVITRSARSWRWTIPS